MHTKNYNIITDNMYVDPKRKYELLNEPLMKSKFIPPGNTNPNKFLKNYGQ